MVNKNVLSCLLKDGKEVNAVDGETAVVQVKLSGARLMAILKGYGEYPTKYRLITALLMLRSKLETIDLLQPSSVTRQADGRRS